MCPERSELDKSESLLSMNFFSVMKKVSELNKKKASTVRANKSLNKYDDRELFPKR
jgi:hypothetical protein